LAVDTVTVVAVANGIRCATATSVGVYGAGGTMKSAVLTAVPSGVVTVMGPEPAFLGTEMASDVGVAVATLTNDVFKRVRSFA
jgi:hypothetical protein